MICITLDLLYQKLLNLAVLDMHTHLLSVSISHTHIDRMFYSVVTDLHRLGQSLSGQVWLSAPHQGPEPGRHRWSPAGTDHPDHR